MKMDRPEVSVFGPAVMGHTLALLAFGLVHLVYGQVVLDSGLELLGYGQVVSDYGQVVSDFGPVDLAYGQVVMEIGLVAPLPGMGMNPGLKPILRIQHS